MPDDETTEPIEEGFDPATAEIVDETGEDEEPELKEPEE